MSDTPPPPGRPRVLAIGLTGHHARLARAIARTLGPCEVATGDRLTPGALLANPVPTLLVIGHEPPAHDAMPILRAGRFLSPHVPLLVYAATSRERVAVEAFKAGASGFVPAAAPEAEVDDAIREVLAPDTEAPALRWERERGGLLSTIGVGTFRSTPDGDITAVNDVMRRLLSGPAVASSHVPVPRGKVAPETVASWRGRDARALPPLRWSLTCADGATLDVEGDARAVDDGRGEVLGFEGYLQDVTRSRLDREEVEYRAMLLDQVPHAVIGTDERFQITLWNRGAERLLGWTSAEALGKAARELLRLSQPPEGESRAGGGVPHPLQLAVEQGLRTAHTWQGDFQCAGSDGRPRDVHCRVVRLRLGEGRTEYVGMLVDVAERRRLESELRLAVVDRERLLSEAHRRVKNNLQVVSSLINIQLSRHADRPLRQFAQEAQNRIRAIALLHEWLLQAPDTDVVDMRSYLPQIARYLATTYADQSTGQVSCEADDISLDLDTATRIGVIVNELVVNALKYAFTGQDAGTVDIRFVRGPAHMAELIVRDSGIGLPAETEPSRVGSLGLRLVRDLAVGAGATMHIARERGTTFSFSFPLPD